jgi:tetratricopeptide (TPR) repeat protein
MPNFADPAFRDLNDANRAAQELLDKNQFVDARKAFTEVRERCRKLGIDASWPSWGIAVSSDSMGEYEMAFENMMDALRTDPLNLGKQASFDAIVQRLRAALSAPERATSDPSTPRIYKLLVQANEADIPSHLAMVRHLSATGDSAGAMRLVTAVTVLAPSNRQAWEAKGALARAEGNLELAQTCEVEAAACAATVPFGVPRASMVC